MKSPADGRITTAVVINQALWTAGYSFTSGGFLLYFGRALGAEGLVISLLLVVPETAATFGLAARWIIRKLGSRKWVFFGFSIAARVVSLGIPLLAFPALLPAGFQRLWVMVALLAAVHVLQSVAYLAYLSWLSDLVPDRRWGRFFSTRNIAKVSVLLVVPVAGGYLRDWWRSDAPADTALWAYVAAFAVGTILQLLSLLSLR